MIASLNPTLRGWCAYFQHAPPIGAPIPMRKQLTGELVAGELHTGFGGRGRRQPFPPPIPLRAAHECRLRALRRPESRIEPKGDSGSGFLHLLPAEIYERPLS
ncbi:MAG: hypothetical protein ABSF31_04270 [Steroidobacteraceae bacterium]